MSSDDIEFDIEIRDDDPEAKKDTSTLDKLPINSNARRIFVGVRRNRVLELKLEGKGYGEIADQIEREYRNDPDLNVDDLPDCWGYKAAASDISQVLDKVISEVEEKARHYLWLEVRRIENILGMLYVKIMEEEDPPLYVIDRYNKLSKRLSKMLGFEHDELVLRDEREQDEEQNQVRSFKWADPEDAPDQFKKLDQNNGTKEGNEEESEE